MRQWNRAWLRMRGLVHRRQLDRDLEEELRFHLDMLGQEHSDARRRFGNAALLKEACRDLWSLGAVETWWQDFRYALRVLRQNRAFTCVAVLTLALAIGATTAVFSVVNGVMLRSLPYRDSARLALLWTSIPRDQETESSTSIPNYLDWKSQTRTFEDLAFYLTSGATLLDPAGRVDPETVRTADVSPNFFSVLGVSPAIGRAFSAREAAGGEPVVVLSHQQWTRRFGRAPDILGRTVDLDGAIYQVVGVMPESFRFPNRNIELWTAGRRWAQYAAMRQRPAVVVFGRVCPGKTMAQAQAELSAIAGRLEMQYPESNRGVTARVVPLQAQILGATVPFMLLILSGAVLFVLLIACANVANLLLARGTAREREFALRAALGAGRVRLVRQVLTESIVLALGGALLGLPLAAWGVRILATLGPQSIPRLDEVRMDGGVLVFTLVLTLTGGILFGLAPALKILRHGPDDSFSVRNRSVHGGARSMRRVLVIAEFSLAMVLLAGAGLLIRSFVAAQAVDPGFRAEHVVTMELNLRHDDAFYQQAMDRIRTIPGVQAVGSINDIFFLHDEKSMGTGTLAEVEGRPREPRDRWRPLVITPNSGDAFQALGIRLLKGRFFSPHDDEKAPLVVIVNEAFARRFWPGENPVGKRFKGLWPPEAWVTVVGLVQDVRNLGLEKQAASQMFAPPRQFKPGAILVVRAVMPTAQLVAAVRAIVRAMDRKAVVGQVATLEEQLYQQTAARRFQSWLMGLFAAIALLLAGVGIYGLLHYSVAQRTQEIGVRMALGARAGDVVRMVVREGLALALTGVAMGVAGALAVMRLIAGLLFGVRPADPVTFGAVVLLLTGVAALACYVPARRATRVDPMTALRCE